ncbi:MAG: hypothetical protein ACHP8B_07525 [Terriglobales bacterium]
MRAHALGKLVALLVLLGSVSSVQGASWGHGGESVGTGVLQKPQDKLPASLKEQEELHLRCVQASEVAEGDAAAMVPDRTWTWRLDFEESRRHLDQLRRDFTALRDNEAAFEASLTSEQEANVRSQLKRLHELSQHLESDAQSLDLELRKGYPTRWHVARDVSDMHKEIRNWRKLHQQVASAVGADRAR